MAHFCHNVLKSWRRSLNKGIGPSPSESSAEGAPPSSRAEAWTAEVVGFPAGLRGIEHGCGGLAAQLGILRLRSLTLAALRRRRAAVDARLVEMAGGEGPTPIAGVMFSLVFGRVSVY